MLYMDEQKMTRKQFFKLKEKNLMFITNPGRMGDEDGTTFIIKKGFKCIPYRIDGWMYGPKDDKDYISMGEVLEVFPKWKEAWFNASVEDRSNDEKYKYIYMGFGNGLCVDKKIYDKFEPYFKKEKEIYAEAYDTEPDEPGVAYNTWEQAVIEMGILNKKYIKDYDPRKPKLKFYDEDEVEDDEKEYTYVSVAYSDNIIACTVGEPSFYYKTDIEDISIGDIVLVDRLGKETLGKVVDIEHCNYDDAPYPVEDTKDIIKVVSKEEADVFEYMKEFELHKEEYKNYYEDVIYGRDPLLSIVPLSCPIDYESLPKKYIYEKEYRDSIQIIYDGIKEILDTKRLTQRKFDSMHERLFLRLGIFSLDFLEFEQQLMWINMSFVNLILLDSKSADKLSKYIHIPVDNDILKEVGYRKKAWLKNGDYSGYLEFQKWYREVYDKEDY